MFFKFFVFGEVILIKFYRFNINFKSLILDNSRGGIMVILYFKVSFILFFFVYVFFVNLLKIYCFFIIYLNKSFLR